MQQMRDIVGTVAQSNHYMVSFSALNSSITRHLSGYMGIDDVIQFLSRKSGLLCSEASLPTSSFATGEVKDNFMGIPQEFAHTRLYTDIDFTFYVDNDYTNLMIFEGWMDYISSAGEIGELNENYYRRFQYPDTYKVQSMIISKFEKNYSSQIDYQFINAFPKTMTSIPVSYGEADLLKVTVSFNYDRYIMNPKGRYRKSNVSFFNDMTRTAGSSGIIYKDKNVTEKVQEQNNNNKNNNNKNNNNQLSGKEQAQKNLDNSGYSGVYLGGGL